MNAAARILNESLIIATHPDQLKRIIFSKQMLLLAGLIGALMLSVLGVITIADKNRIEIGELSSLAHNRNEILTHYNQLLLEENTWAAPARIENLAQTKYSMVQPDPKKVIVIQS